MSLLSESGLERLVEGRGAPQGHSGLGNEGLVPVLVLTLSDPGSAVFDFQISKRERTFVSDTFTRLMSKLPVCSSSLAV